ncbi:MAG: hypothetical protein OXF02_06790 [Simkaniaceae bacterium]|nr:hypothetical protein [Simkaniaceae bacterium]
MRAVTAKIETRRFSGRRIPGPPPQSAIMEAVLAGLQEQGNDIPNGGIGASVAVVDIALVCVGKGVCSLVAGELSKGV